MKFIAWLALAAALLGGCAQIHWERAFYDGMRTSAAQQARRAGPEAVPHTPLPEHAAYDAERRRLQRAQ
jgi:hypothetical protein